MNYSVNISETDFGRFPLDQKKLQYSLDNFLLGVRNGAFANTLIQANSNVICGGFEGNFRDFINYSQIKKTELGLPDDNSFFYWCFEFSNLFNNGNSYGFLLQVFSTGYDSVESETFTVPTNTGDYSDYKTNFNFFSDFLDQRSTWNNSDNAPNDDVKINGIWLAGQLTV
jgi:hypothetical protein